MTTPEYASVLGTKGASKPGIGAKIGNALLSVCLAILKAIGEAILSVIRFVVEVFVETIIDLRWILLIGLSLMALLWVWMQNDPHRPRTRPYHLDPSPVRIMR